MKVTEILNENMKDFVQTTSELDSKEVYKKLLALLKKYEKAAKTLVTDSTTTPAGPDTSKFRAHKSGEVALEKNVTIHGAYNHSVRYADFLKIGGAIAYAKRKTTVDDKFLADVKKFVADVASENMHIKCADGENVSINFSHGTNWGGIGIRY